MAIQPGAFFAPNINDPLISTLALVHKPDIYSKLIGRYPRQRFLDFLTLMGRMVPVAQTSYSTTEENRIMNPITIGAVSNPSGTNALITLGPGSYFTDPATSASYSYPRVGDRVEFINGTQGYIIAKNVATPNAHTITVQAVNANYNPFTASNVGDYVGLFSMAYAEGGTGPTEVLVPQIDTFSNNCQIFYDWMSVTSSEQGNETWVKYDFPDDHPMAGQSGNFYFIKAEADMVDRFKLKRELGLFTNDIGDGSVIDPINNSNFPIRFTRGFIPTLRNYAQGMDYVGQPGMGTFDAIVRLMNKNYSELENMLLMGLNFGLGFKNFGVDLMKNGAFVYNSSTGEQMDATSLGFKTLEYSTGHTFHCQTLAALAHADTTGLPGMTYPDIAIVAPMQKVTDKNTGMEMDPFAVKYKKPEGKGANKFFKIWETGGNSPNGTDKTLTRSLNMECEEGAQVYGAQRFVLITKKAA
jgi:hypothetical protein